MLDIVIEVLFSNLIPVKCLDELFGFGSQSRYGLFHGRFASSAKYKIGCRKSVQRAKSLLFDKQHFLRLPLPKSTYRYDIQPGTGYLAPFNSPGMRTGVKLFLKLGANPPPGVAKFQAGFSFLGQHPLYRRIGSCRIGYRRQQDKAAGQGGPVVQRLRLGVIPGQAFQVGFRR